MKISDNKEELFSSLPHLEQKHYDIINDNIQTHYMTYRHAPKGLDDSGFVELPAGTVCRCSHCKRETFTVKTPQNKAWINTLIHNKESTCPDCKHKVIVKAEGRGRTSIRNRYRIAVFIPVDFNTVWARCYDFTYYDYTDVFEPKEYYYEAERVLLTSDGAFHWEEMYDYSGYITGKRGSIYWKLFSKPHEPFANKGSFYNPGFYEFVDMASIDETFLKYSGYGEYIDTRYNTSEADSIVKYLEYYSKYPCLEYIVKAGFIRLAASLVEQGKKGRNCLDWKARNFYGFFRLGKADIKSLSEINPDSDDAAEYITFARRHPEISGAVEKLHNAIGRYGNIDTVNEILKTEALANMPAKLLNYLSKTKTSSSDYLDYIKQCTALEYSLNDERVLFPKSFTEAHNHATKALRIIADAETNKRIQKRKRILSKFIYENERFVILIPESVEEIIGEGENLSHCVGRYAEGHSNGVTNILFLRYKRKPEKAFYTVEMDKDGTVLQCRGMKNCGQTKRVEAFMNAFEKHSKKAAKRKNTRKTKVKTIA